MITLIVPFYRNELMLAEQIRNWEGYPEDFKIVLVDDGSPEQAMPIIRRHASTALLERLQVFRVAVDIPWNRGGARNLGTSVAESEWILHVDIDHVLIPACAERLMRTPVHAGCWYRFPRFRRGAADDTRRKDAIARDVDYGPVKPHIDSYLCTRTLFWRAGGYNEDFSGCLGGGSPFLQALEQEAPLAMLPDDVFLEVYTRHAVKDASDFSLSRDTTEFTRRKATMKSLRGHHPIRFAWERVH